MVVFVPAVMLAVASAGWSGPKGLALSTKDPSKMIVAAQDLSAVVMMDAGSVYMTDLSGADATYLASDVHAKGVASYTDAANKHWYMYTSGTQLTIASLDGDNSSHTYTNPIADTELAYMTIKDQVLYIMIKDPAGLVRFNLSSRNWLDSEMWATLGHGASEGRGVAWADTSDGLYTDSKCAAVLLASSNIGLHVIDSSGSTLYTLKTGNMCAVVDWESGVTFRKTLCFQKKLLFLEGNNVWYAPNWKVDAKKGLVGEEGSIVLGNSCTLLKEKNDMSFHDMIFTAADDATGLPKHVLASGSQSEKIQKVSLHDARRLSAVSEFPRMEQPFFTLM